MNFILTLKGNHGGFNDTGPKPKYQWICPGQQLFFKNIIQICNTLSTLEQINLQLHVLLHKQQSDKFLITF
jgi:hypothetical protein